MPAQTSPGGEDRHSHKHFAIGQNSTATIRDTLRALSRCSRSALGQHPRNRELKSSQAIVISVKNKQRGLGVGLGSRVTAAFKPHRRRRHAKKASAETPHVECASRSNRFTAYEVRLRGKTWTYEGVGHVTKM